MSASISLKGKTALVTGGGRGIGKAIAKKFAEAGATVVIASRKMENLKATADELAGLPGKIVPLECHVGRADQLTSLVATIDKQYGGVDILVNNSATNIGQGPALEVTDGMLDKMIEVNIKAALRLVRLTVPGMIQKKSGSIINIASIAGLRPQTRTHKSRTMKTLQIQQRKPVIRIKICCKSWLTSVFAGNRLKQHRCLLTPPFTFSNTVSARHCDASSQGSATGLTFDWRGRRNLSGGDGGRE